MTNFLQVTGFNPLIVSEPQGPAGPQGQQGIVGPQGPPGDLDSSQINQPNGIAGLDGTGKIGADQVPDLTSSYAQTSRTRARAVGQGELMLNVLDYGLKGDGTVENTTSLYAAINAATMPVSVFFPPTATHYNLQSPLPDKGNVTYFGANEGGTQIAVTAGSLLAPASFRYSVHFRNLSLYGYGSHLIDLGTAGGLVNSSFTECILYSSPFASSIINGNGNVTLQGVVFERCQFSRQSGATVAAFNVTATGGVNGFAVTDCTATSGGATSTPFFSLQASGTGAMRGVVFERLTGEQNNGGLISLLSVIGATLKDVVDYDATGNYTASLVTIGKNSTGAVPDAIYADNIRNTAGTIDGQTTFHLQFTTSTSQPPVVHRTQYVQTLAGYGAIRTNGWGASGPTITYTASYTLLDGVDGVAVFNGSTLTATLPDPTTVPVGRRFTVKNVNASALTIVSAGTSKTIDGAASQSVVQWAKLTVFTDGTQWLSM